MYAVMAQSWNFIGGLAGYPSFANGGVFRAGGIYRSGSAKSRAPMLLTWGCAGLAATLFAAFIGGAILHLRGHYFAIASLIIAEMLREVVNVMPDLTGGGKGMNLPNAGHVGRSAITVLFLLHACPGRISTATAIVVRRSKLGFGLRCIQQNESAADILGVNAYAYKTAAFCLSAVFVSIAGAIYASWVHYIDPTDVF